LIELAPIESAVDQPIAGPQDETQSNVNETGVPCHTLGRDSDRPWDRLRSVPL